MLVDPPLPLAQLTTLRTGAAPARMVEARTREELITALEEVTAAGDEWLVVGGGSNLFAGDQSFPGTVILVRTSGIRLLPAERAGYARVRVEAGHEWDDVVSFTVAEGLAGIEAMSGIPGTIGAAPVQNIGAYGQELVQTLVEVELWDAETGEVEVVPADGLGLGFRTSVLKSHYGSVADRSGVILSVTLELAAVGHGDLPVRGEQLRHALRLDDDARVSLAWIRDTVLRTRASKGMVLDAADPDTASAGSFFQNAIVPAAFARTLPEECPRWPLSVGEEADLVVPLETYQGLAPRPVRPEPDVKVSAAWLIEHAGLRKGFSLPRSRAGLSTKHALALTNRGGASAEEIAELARFIRLRVHSEFGLMLQPEPVLVDVEL